MTPGDDEEGKGRSEISLGQKDNQEIQCVRKVM